MVNAREFYLLLYSIALKTILLSSLNLLFIFLRIML